MFLTKLKNNKTDYVHVISALEHPKKLIISKFSDAVIIHCTTSNVHIVEYEGSDLDNFCNFLKKLKIVRLQTTNENIYKKLLPFFKHHYFCCQAIYEKKGNYFPEEFKLLQKNDLPYVQETYGMSEYILQLFERNRLFGWYEENLLKGYVAFHIDETVGALFVKPEFRKKGLGSKIMKAAFEKYDSGTTYAQILSENEASVKLHKKINCTISSKPVYWLYNEEYNYS